MVKKIGIVIPVRNEEQSLAKVLENIPFLGSHVEMKVFVVDDGSEDGTHKIAVERGAEVVRHPVSLGVGGALKTGYLLAKNWGADIIVQLDADGEHDPAELPTLLDYALNGDADMVVGSRFLNGDPSLSLTRKVGIKFFTWLVNTLTGFKLTDITSGYRVFRGDVLDKIMFPSEKHWAIEMTLLASRSGVRIKEEPIRPTTRKTGRSQFHEVMTFLLYPIMAIKQIISVYI